MKNSLVSGNLVILWPLIIVIIGLILYWTCTPNPAKPKVARLGEITFFAGMIGLTIALINHSFHIFD